MASTKISEMPEVFPPIVESDVLPIIHDGQNQKVSIARLFVLLHKNAYSDPQPGQIAWDDEQGANGRPVVNDGTNWLVLAVET